MRTLEAMRVTNRPNIAHGRRNKPGEDVAVR